MEFGWLPPLKNKSSYGELKLKIDHKLKIVRRMLKPLLYFQ